MNTIDTHNTISSVQLADIIKTSAKAIMTNPDLSTMIPPVLVRGGAGVGKSSIVKSVADELGIGFVDLRLAQLERVDLCGLPSVEKGTTKWNVPSVLPSDPDSKGILFLDEITAAPQDVIVACYALVLERRIPNSDYVLPKGWLICAAGNRTTDRSVAHTLPAAFANRFAHYELEANADDWYNWAVANDVHPSVTGFIKYRPGLLFKMDGENLDAGWPSPRSWARVSAAIPLFADEEVLSKVVYGLVGQNAGIEMLAFHKSNKRFEDVIKMLTDPKADINIPSKADERYALCSCVNYHLWAGDTEAEHKKRVEGLFRIINELPKDFAAMTLKAATLGNVKVNRLVALKLIMTSKGYKDYQKKHGSKIEETFRLDLKAA